MTPRGVTTLMTPRGVTTLMTPRGVTTNDEVRCAVGPANPRCRRPVLVYA
jgi:hypothetical protein